MSTLRISTSVFNSGTPAPFWAAGCPCRDFPSTPPFPPADDPALDIEGGRLEYNANTTLGFSRLLKARHADVSMSGNYTDATSGNPLQRQGTEFPAPMPKFAALSQEELRAILIKTAEEMRPLSVTPQNQAGVVSRFSALTIALTSEALCRLEGAYPPTVKLRAAGTSIHVRQFAGTLDFLADFLEYLASELDRPK